MIARPSTLAARALAVDTQVEDPAWGEAAVLGPLVESVVSAAGERLPVPPGSEIAVLLSDDARIQALNRNFRGKDAVTNVLSFPARPGAAHLGDIIVARETVEREAAAEGKTRDRHLTHLLVHGVLHLFGYDHDSDDDAAEMEALEIEILASLGVPDPYAGE